MQKINLYLASIGICTAILAGCGKSPSAQSRFCQMAIEDVFLPIHKLQILDSRYAEKDGAIESTIEYAITDATGKRVTDTAICTFDSDPDAIEIKTLTQFNNHIPPSHIEFLNKRIAAKLAALSNPAKTPTTVNAESPPKIDLSAPPEQKTPDAEMPVSSDKKE